jgi:hypothetical protein
MKSGLSVDVSMSFALAIAPLKMASDRYCGGSPTWKLPSGFKTMVAAVSANPSTYQDG